MIAPEERTGPLVPRAVFGRAVDHRAHTTEPSIVISLSQLLYEVVNKLVLHVALSLVDALSSLFFQVDSKEYDYENPQSGIEKNEDN